VSIITDDNVTAFIRSLVGESTAKHWTNDEITLYKKFGMMAVQAKYWYLLYPEKVMKATADMTSGTDYIALPDNCFKIGKLEVYNNGSGDGKHLRIIGTDEVHKYESWAAGDPIACVFADSKVYLYPTPNRTVSSFFRYWYLEYFDEVTDFPECMRPLIAIEAVLFAKTKDKSVTVDVLAMQQRLEEIVYHALAMSQIQEPDIIGDYEVDEGYYRQEQS
jgi:hypothetical protein